MAKLLFMLSAVRPVGVVRATGRQLTVVSIAGRAAAAALYCRYGITLSAPVRCGAIGGGGGGAAGGRCILLPGRGRECLFPFSDSYRDV